MRRMVEVGLSGGSQAKRVTRRRRRVLVLSSSRRTSSSRTDRGWSCGPIVAQLDGVQNVAPPSLVSVSIAFPLAVAVIVVVVERWRPLEDGRVEVGLHCSPLTQWLGAA